MDDLRRRLEALHPVLSWYIVLVEVSCDKITGHVHISEADLSRSSHLFVVYLYDISADMKHAYGTVAINFLSQKRK